MSLYPWEISISLEITEPITKPRWRSDNTLITGWMRYQQRRWRRRFPRMKLYARHEISQNPSAAGHGVDSLSRVIGRTGLRENWGGCGYESRGRDGIEGCPPPTAIVRFGPKPTVAAETWLMCIPSVRALVNCVRAVGVMGV